MTVIRAIKTLIPAPKDGVDAVNYELQSSVAVITADADGNITTGGIEVTAYKIVGDTKSGLTLITPDQTNYALYPYYTAEYRIDGGSWTRCGRILRNNQLVCGISQNSVATTTQRISIRLLEIKSSSAYRIIEYTPDLTIVKDGKTGEAGPRYYYEGVYPSAGQRMEIIDGWAPVVEFHASGDTEVYWYLNAKNNVASNGTYIAPSAENNTWKLADKFSVFITEAIFAKYAQFGGAILNGNWEMSANGMIGALSVIGTSKITLHNPSGNRLILPQSLFDPNNPRGVVNRIVSDIEENPNGSTAYWAATSTGVIWHTSVALTAGEIYVFSLEADTLGFALDLVVGDSYGNVLMTLERAAAGSSICIGGIFSVNTSGTYQIGIRDIAKNGGAAKNTRFILQKALFVPNYCVNLSAGESYQKKAYSEGGTRSPFQYVSGTEFSQALWNNCAIFTGTMADVVTAYTLPWDVTQSGRRIIITNAYWGDQLSYGDANIVAPTGKCFFNNGRKLGNCKVHAREGVELLGYGSKDVFYGWIVLRKFDMITSYKYGRELKCLAFGAVTGTSSTASLSGVATENTSINLSVTRSSQGRYVLSWASGIFASSDKVIAQLTAMGSVTSVTIASRTTTSITVETRSGTSLVDGGFTFALFNSAQW